MRPASSSRSGSASTFSRPPKWWPFLQRPRRRETNWTKLTVKVPKVYLASRQKALRDLCPFALLLAACVGCGGTSLPEPGQRTNPPASPLAQTIRVVDGDTMDVDGERHRIAGIDAPERRQTCIDANGTTWPCGAAATQAVEAMIGDGGVSCTTLGRDRYGRSVSSCSAGGVDIGEALVLAGLALNEPRYTPDRSDAETQAREEEAGMHAGRFMPPWSWRAGARLTPLNPSILASDATMYGPGMPVRVVTSCNLATCTLTFDDRSATFSVAELLPEDRPEGPIEPHTVADDGTEFMGFGYWLQQSGFVVVMGSTAPAVEVLVPVSIAEQFPETNPRPLDGGATWRGHMSGIDANAGKFAVLGGRTTISLDDFSNPSIEVLFDRIHEIETGAVRSDMSWSGIVIQDGAFATGESGNRFLGRFYGDTHQEVGGVFTRDGITGAFGAKRSR